VLILGAGVAGLQAIATARRLGAQVQAYDPRPEVAEQVKSLGAKFVELDLGPSEKDEQGYAKGLSEKQLEEQRRQLGDMCAKSDIVVTAAQVFGKRAPILVTDEMRGKMRAGSVVVDLAAATGGNVSGVEPGTEITDSGGVRILGFPQFAARVPVDASRMYANNLAYLIEHAWDKDAGTLKLDPGDDRVVDAVMLVQRGEKRDSGSAAKARADQEKTEQTQKEETAAA
jgi:NAD(P) transhydrogenase subunit alpha